MRRGVGMRRQNIRMFHPVYNLPFKNAAFLKSLHGVLSDHLAAGQNQPANGLEQRLHCCLPQPDGNPIIGSP